jgi:protein TonB
MVGLLVLAAFTVFQSCSHEEEPKPFVFELASEAPSPSNASPATERTPKPAASEAEVEPFHLPDLDTLKEMDVTPLPPEPEPDPIREPEPASAEPAPRQLTYDEFLRQQGRPEPRQQTRTQSRPRPTVAVPEISAVAATRELQALMDSSSPRRTTGTDASANARYGDELRASILARFSNPVGNADEELSTTIKFNVLSSGKVTGARIIRPSGNSGFDLAALTAVRETPGVGPTPAGEAFRGIRLVFRNRDLR